MKNMLDTDDNIFSEKKKTATYSKKELGAFGESIALKYFIDEGYTILTRNFRFGRFGEIDIIVQKGDILRFVEVKTRTDNQFGTPGESVTNRKKKRIVTVAKYYLSSHNAENLRPGFDVLEIYLGKDEHSNYLIKEINHIENAFQ